MIWPRRLFWEVERAPGDVEANAKRIQATRWALELAEEHLRGQERRFEMGLVTQKDVIDFQSQLLDVRGRTPCHDGYNNSASKLRLADGKLLQSYNWM